MSEVSAIPSPLAEGQGLSLAARFWGILTSPGETFADVAARPRWFGMMALVLIVTAVSFGAFFSTEVGQTAELARQLVRWLDERINDRLGVLARHSHEHEVSRLALHQRGDLAVRAAEEQTPSQ